MGNQPDISTDLRGKSSNPWSFLTEIFQPLEKVRTFFPMFGTFYCRARVFVFRAAFSASMDDDTFSENVYSNTFLVEQRDRATRTTRYQHDALGRVTNLTDNAGRATAYEYNCDCGGLTDLIDAAGNRTEWVYDSEGRMTYKVYNDDSEIAYAYNADGLLTSRINARNQTTLYEYDKTSKLTQIDYETDTDITTQYDPLGRVTNVTDAVGQTTFTYSPSRGLLTQVDGPFVNDTLVYSHDAAGRSTNLTCGAYSVDYSYDSLSRLKTIGGQQGPSTYAYPGNGTRIASLSHPNGLNRTLAYDNLHRVTNVLNHIADETVSSFGYTLNDADQRTRIRRDSYTIDYGYDPVGQLLSAQAKQDNGTERPGHAYAYSYDQTGNPERQERNGFIVSNRFNNLNQNIDSTWDGSVTVMGSVNTKEGTITVNGIEAALLENQTFVATNLSVAGGTNSYTAIITDPFGRAATNTSEVVVADKNYSYDADGNLLSDGRFTYAWNNENRLASTTDGSTTISNSYDYMERRVSKVVNGVTNTFLYDGWNLVEERSGTNVTRYIWGLDLSGSSQGAGGAGGLVCVVENGEEYYPCFDANGNIYRYVDGTGTNVVAYFEYSPFGKIIVQGGAKAGDVKFRFSTKYFDAETGLYYYGFRYYNPELGRWLSREPLGESASYGLYTFVDNQPIQKIDILGLYGNPISGPGGAVGGGNGPYDPSPWDPPLPPGYWYGNWGGPGWANGEGRPESGSLPKPGDSDYKPPIDSRDSCYEGHDQCISACPKCPTATNSKCIKGCDHTLANCLYKAGEYFEGLLFDTLIPWLIH